MNEIFQKFNSITRNKINYQIGKRRKSDIVISISNPNKLIKYTQWKPKQNNLVHVLKSSLKWYKKSMRMKTK